MHYGIEAELLSSQLSRHIELTQQAFPRSRICGAAEEQPLSDEFQAHKLELFDAHPFDDSIVFEDGAQLWRALLVPNDSKRGTAAHRVKDQR